jgi:hypothetical protein
MMQDFFVVASKLPDACNPMRHLSATNPGLKKEIVQAHQSFRNTSMYHTASAL